MPQSRFRNLLGRIYLVLCGCLVSAGNSELLAQQTMAIAVDPVELFPAVTATDTPWTNSEQSAASSADPNAANAADEPLTYASKEATSLEWFSSVKTGYDSGFLIAASKNQDLQSGDYPFRLKINGWGQLRYTNFGSNGTNPSQNQFQLTRARLVFSGRAFTPDFQYYTQIDGRSSSGDDLRLLDYFLTYDFGHHRWGLDAGTIGFKTGKYKMPFSLARYLSGREFEFSDRSMASMYFDVNRSLAWGLFGKWNHGWFPINWEAAIFNGLVTGGAETGSSGQLDNNFAYSARIFCFPNGEWGQGSLADFEGHSHLATRVGAGFANSTINRSGLTEFNAIRVVDSGQTLARLLPVAIDQYTVNLFAVDYSCKYHGWSGTVEYYLRNISGFQGGQLPSLFDHGFWLQLGKFIVPGKVQLLARWSRIVGDSGTLGAIKVSSDERAVGGVWYFRDQNAKLTFDTTYLNGASINSSNLDISPGDIGWLFRTQIQFAF